MNAIASQIRHLLSSLDQIAAEGEEIFDSDCRQELGEAVMESFVRAKGINAIPKQFGLLNEDACKFIHDAIALFTTESLTILGAEGFKVRLNSLQDTSIVSENGNDYEEYFGHTPSDFYDEEGNVVKVQ